MTYAGYLDNTAGNPSADPDLDAKLDAAFGPLKVAAPRLMTTRTAPSSGRTVRVYCDVNGRAGEASYLVRAFQPDGREIECYRSRLTRDRVPMDRTVRYAALSYAHQVLATIEQRDADGAWA